MPLKPLGLPENQRLKITLHLPAEKRAADTLASWQQIYAGLSDTDVTEVEAIAWIASTSCRFPIDLMQRGPEQRESRSSSQEPEMHHDISVVVQARSLLVERLGDIAWQSAFLSLGADLRSSARSMDQAGYCPLPGRQWMLANDITSIITLLERLT